MSTNCEHEELVTIPGKRLEDPLLYLPCSRIEVIRAGQLIYDESDPARSLYVMIDGLVMLSHRLENGREVIVDFCQGDDFFGEAALIYNSLRFQRAVTLVNTKVMSWTATELEDRVIKHSKLGIGLVQLAVSRTIRLAERIESLAYDPVPLRLTRTLLSLADRFGVVQQDKSVRLFPIQHKTLAQLIGSTRELVTHQMTRLRRIGCVKYSRKSIVALP